MKMQIVKHSSSTSTTIRRINPQLGIVMTRRTAQRKKMTLVDGGTKRRDRRKMPTNAWMQRRERERGESGGDDRWRAGKRACFWSFFCSGNEGSRNDARPAAGYFYFSSFDVAFRKREWEGRDKREVRDVSALFYSFMHPALQKSPFFHLLICVGFFVVCVCVYVYVLVLINLL